MSQEGLIDYSIIPFSRVQNYETKIEEQSSTIADLSKKVNHLESLQRDDTVIGGPSEALRPNEEHQTPTILDETVTADPVSENTEKSDSNDDPVVKPPLKSVKVIKGKNLNRECLARQLKE